MESNQHSAAHAGTNRDRRGFTVKPSRFRFVRMTGPGIWGEPADSDEEKAGGGLAQSGESSAPTSSTGRLVRSARERKTSCRSFVSVSGRPRHRDTKGGLERTGPDRGPTTRVPSISKGRVRRKACSASPRTYPPLPTAPARPERSITMSQWDHPGAHRASNSRERSPHRPSRTSTSDSSEHRAGDDERPYRCRMQNRYNFG